MTANQFAITSSTVFTGLPACPWVDAVGIKDGIIAAVGSNQAVTTNPISITSESPEKNFHRLCQPGPE